MEEGEEEGGSSADKVEEETVRMREEGREAFRAFIS